MVWPRKRDPMKKPFQIVALLVITGLNLSCYTILKHPVVKTGFRSVNPKISSKCTSCHDQILVHQDPLFSWLMIFPKENDRRIFSRLPSYETRHWWFDNTPNTFYSSGNNDSTFWEPEILPGHPEIVNPVVVEVDTTEVREKQKIPSTAPADRSDESLEPDPDTKSTPKAKKATVPETGKRAPKSDKKKRVPAKPSAKWKKKPKS